MNLGPFRHVSTKIRNVETMRQLSPPRPDVNAFRTFQPQRHPGHAKIRWYPRVPHKFRPCSRERGWRGGGAYPWECESTSKLTSKIGSKPDGDRPATPDRGTAVSERRSMIWSVHHPCNPNFALIIKFGEKPSFTGPGNHRCLGSGQHRVPQKPLQKAGRFAPHLLEWFLGLPGPSRLPRSMSSGPRKTEFS